MKLPIATMLWNEGRMFNGQRQTSTFDYAAFSMNFSNDTILSIWSDIFAMSETFKNTDGDSISSKIF